MIPGLDVLNVSKGHLSINFDNDNDAEVERAKGIIEDMLKRGYTILVEDDTGGLTRVKSFDRKNERYIVSDGSGTSDNPDQPKKKRGRPKGVPMRKARGTGIGQTAGG